MNLNLTFSQHGTQETLLLFGIFRINILVLYNVFLSEKLSFEGVHAGLLELTASRLANVMNDSNPCSDPLLWRDKELQRQ